MNMPHQNRPREPQGSLVFGLLYAGLAVLALAALLQFTRGATETATPLMTLSLATALVLFGAEHWVQRRKQHSSPPAPSPSPRPRVTPPPAARPRLSEAEVWPVTDEPVVSTELGEELLNLTFASLSEMPSALQSRLAADMYTHHGRDYTTRAELSGNYQVSSEGPRYDLRLSMPRA